MALDAQQCADAMFDALQDAGNGADEADARARMRAMVQALFDHIQANATVGALDVAPSGSPVHTHTTVPGTGKIS